MRRLISLALTAGMCLGMMACSNVNSDKSSAAEDMSQKSTEQQAEYTEQTKDSLTTEAIESEPSSEYEEETMGIADARLADIINKIYEEKPVDISLAEIPVSFTDEYGFKAYTGLELKDAKKLDAALVSEAMISAQAYSMTLVRVKDASDAAQIAQSMADGIDQRKWICVEADDLKVVSKDDVIMLVMVDSQLSEVTTAEELTEAFEKVMGGIDGEYTKKN